MGTQTGKSTWETVTKGAFLILSVCFVCFHMYTAFFGAFPGVIQKGVHLGFVMALFFLGEIQTRETKLVKRILYLIFLAAGVCGCAYYVIEDVNIQNRLGVITQPDIIFGLLLLVVRSEERR